MCPRFLGYRHAKTSGHGDCLRPFECQRRESIRCIFESHVVSDDVVVEMLVE